MTWAAGTDRTTGALISAADWNKYLGITGSIMETAAAKFTTAGDLFVGTGANAGARLAAVAAGQVLTSQGVGVAPAWAAPAAGGPCCRVYHSVAQTIATGTSTILAFDSERYDTAAMHDTATNNSRITIPTAGVYAISASVEWSTFGPAAYQLSLQRSNGPALIASQNQYPPSGGLGVRQSIAAIDKFAAGDYVVVVVFQATGGLANVNASGNYSPEFAAAWLGPG
jgi:hypothetical protein